VNGPAAATEADRAGERQGLQAVLAILLTIVVLALAGRDGAVASLPALAAVAVPCAALSVALYLHRHSWGGERTYVDLWSIPHLLAGAFLGLLGIGLARVAAIAVAWELIEIVSRVREHPLNRAIDVALALGGCALVAAVA
jgi:hypothetical protein